MCKEGVKKKVQYEELKKLIKEGSGGLEIDGTRLYKEKMEGIKEKDVKINITMKLKGRRLKERGARRGGGIA